MVRRAAVVAILAAAAGGWWWWNSPARQIARALDAIAQGLSHDQPVGGLAAVASVAGLRERLAPDVVIEAREAPGVPALRGRDAVLAAAMQVRAATAALHVEVSDVEVAVDDPGTLATVRCTVSARRTDRAGQRFVDARELLLTMRRVDGQWVLARAVAESVLEPVT